MFSFVSGQEITVVTASACMRPSPDQYGRVVGEPGQVYVAVQSLFREQMSGLALGDFEFRFSLQDNRRGHGLVPNLISAQIDR